jgi:peptidylprolyl isomerase
LIRLPAPRFSAFRLLAAVAVLAVALLALMPLSAGAKSLDPENTLYMQLTYGRVVIQLRPDLAPNHVKRVKELTRAGFYDGLTFHRVIEDFMAQGGDPRGDGTGGSGKPNLKAEFSNANFGRGSIGAARGEDPNTANSQFFICFGDCSFLNGEYTLWGQVVEGMEFVDKIKRGEPPANPDRIVRMQVAADVKS